MASPPLDLAVLPRGPGVYRFRDARDRALYIGRAVDLRRRVRSYWGSQRGRPRMRRMVPQIAAVEVVSCASEHEAAWLERNLLERSRPRWNRVRGGLEVPVLLRLDPGPRTPSLTVTHRMSGPFPHFGPYLGGTRVRTAVAALASLYPVAYTAEATSGSELAMAEARGVAPADRPGIVAALTRVLERDPAAVASAHRALEERRDRAAADLEFERAGLLQEQLLALDWLTSPQRVTGQDRADGVVAGWAEGVLVEFGLVGGRLSTWVQRVASLEDAAPSLAATGSAWTDFAARNAALAAQLRAGAVTWPSLGRCT